MLVTWPWRCVNHSYMNNWRTLSEFCNNRNYFYVKRSWVSLSSVFSSCDSSSFFWLIYFIFFFLRRHHGSCNKCFSPLAASLSYTVLVVLDWCSHWEALHRNNACYLSPPPLSPSPSLSLFLSVSLTFSLSLTHYNVYLSLGLFSHWQWTERHHHAYHLYVSNDITNIYGT